MILVLSDLYVPFPGGAERLIFNLARHLMRAGEDVRVLTGYHEAQQFDGPRLLETVSLPITPVHPSDALLRSIIEAVAPDVILTHHYWAREFEEPLCASGVPIVQVVLNGPRLRCAALAVYISEYVRSQPDKTPQAQDMTILPPAFDDVRAETHGDAIGFIKPYPHKGAELVYRIAERMPERRFVILRGEWQDLELIERLPNVEYMEPVVDIRDFYARVRLVLMPSISEDAGTVAQECTVNGIPCISSDVGGLPETNRGGVRLTNPTAGEWAAVIRDLDDPAKYAAVVGYQHERTPTDQRLMLDEFAERVRKMREYGASLRTQ